MNNLPSKTALRLIAGIESGEIAPSEAARQIAQVHTASRENYSQTIIGGLIMSGIAWAITGGSIILPIAILFLTYDTFQKSRTDRLLAFQDINRGNFMDYLPDADRELFEDLEVNSIDVESTPEQEAIAAVEQKHPQLENLECGDVAKAVAQTLKPLIISARPRVGKGIFVNNVIHHAKQIHNACTWCLQPKPTQVELAYWKECDRFLGINLEDFDRDDTAVADRMTQFFMEWRSSSPRPTILVIDEIVKIQALQPKWFKSFLIPQLLVEASSGETDNRFVIAITQSPLTSDLGLSGGNRSAFDFMVIERYWDQDGERIDTTEHAQSARASFRSLQSTPTPEDYKISPVGCLVYHSTYGKWAGLPRYEIPCIHASDRLCFDLMTLVRSTEPSRNHGSISGSNPEPMFRDGSMGRTLYQTGYNEGLESIGSGSEPPGTYPEPIENRPRIVLELNRKGWNQTDIIDLIWGASRGGGTSYLKAIEEYREIISSADR